MPNPETCENNSSLTEKQQEALDCTTCFTVHGRTVEAADIVQCRRQSVSTARSTLASLEKKGLVENKSLVGARKNLYSTTYPGMQASTPELDPWTCETANSTELSLTSLQQQVIDCAVCLTERDLPIQKATLAPCIGSAATAAYVLGNLEGKGLLHKKASKSTHQNEYMLMLDGRNAATRIESNPECQAEAPSAPEERPLNDQENQLLSCLRCQTARGLEPDRLRASLCSGMSKVAIGNAAATLIDREVVESVPATQKPGLRTSGALRALKLKNVRSSRHQPDCNIEALEAKFVFGRLSPERKKILGCMACILSQDEASPGVVGADVARCTDLSSATTGSFLHQMSEEGYATRRTGLSVAGISAPFYTPTERGKSLLDQLDAVQECNKDRLWHTEERNNIEEAVIRCTSCIWTQQIAAGQEPRATADMIAECSGFDRSNIASSILPRLVEKGDYTVMESRPRRYLPAPGSASPLGYNVDCHLDLFDDISNVLAAIPQEYIMQGTEEDSLKRFEAYVGGLRSGQIHYDTDDEYDPFKNKHAFPLLTAEEESYLGLIIQQNANQSLVEKAKFRFLNANVRLASWMASERKFETAITSFEDVRQAALLGVSDAIDRFNPLMGFKFSTFAYHRMLGRIQHITAASVGVPAYVLSDIPLTLHVTHEFVKKHGRPPTPVEIAAHTGKSLGKVLKILAGLDHIRSPISFHQQLNSSGEGTFEIIMGKDDSKVENAQNIDLFKKATKFLDDTERGMLEKVVIGEDKLAEFARDNEMNYSTAQKTFGRLMAKIRHPYFGLGMHLDSMALDWHRDARCQVEDESVFVNFKGVATKELEVFCGQCPVSEQCQRFAQDSKPHMGVWAGQLASSYKSNDDFE